MSILTPSQLARVRRFEEGGSTGDTTTTQPYVSGVTKTETRIDPITQQLLFGLDGQGGFIPGAFRAAERTFFDEEGRPIVIPQEIAGFSPDQIRAMEMARANVGVQQPFIDEAMRRGQEGIGSIQQGLTDQAVASQQALQAQQEGARFALDQRDRGLMESLRGTQEGRGRAIAAEERLRGDISDLSRRGVRDTQRFGMDLASARQQGRRSYDEFGRDITDTLGMGMSEAQRYRSGLGESQELLRGTADKEFDVASATAKYQDPYEDQVVQQMIEDAREGLAKQDTAQLARDIQTGGQSAFGSRARLTGQERAEAMGRGLGKAIGSLRSQGFQQAQQTAIGEDERQKQAARAASSGLASLQGQSYGAGRDVTGQMAQAAGQKLSAGQGYGNLLQQTAQAQLGAQQQLGGQLGQMAQQRYAAGTGLGQTLSGYGQQSAAARQAAGQTGMNVAGTLAGQYGQIGAQQAAGGQALGQAQTGYGSFLSGLGSQAQQAGAQDVAAMQGIGGMAQQNRQQQLDAQRAGLLQAQQAPLAQYQALMPFVSMAPAGQTQFQTNFGPPPSALQAGLGTGLATVGALGNYYNPSSQLSGSR
jgi:Sec-independent protein translocase protein TatA